MDTTGTLIDSDLLDFLSGFAELDEEERVAIGKNIPVKQYKKGTTLVSEGEIPAECYFVLQGCVRQYYLVDGDEKTTAFFTERQAVAATNFIDQTPSKYYLACVEDAKLIVGSIHQDKEMYNRFPKLANITRVMIEQDFNNTRENFAAFVTSSPEKRYVDLLTTRPNLLNRVPQHQIASYLGITPESLSRIRKRISLKK
jgi:CRP-like cAMP-binding protein